MLIIFSQCWHTSCLLIVFVVKLVTNCWQVMSILVPTSTSWSTQPHSTDQRLQLTFKTFLSAQHQRGKNFEELLICDDLSRKPECIDWLIRMKKMSILKIIFGDSAAWFTREAISEQRFFESKSRLELQIEQRRAELSERLDKWQFSGVKIMSWSWSLGSMTDRHTWRVDQSCLSGGSTEWKS